MTISIRDAGPDDARGIASVHIETWQSAYGDILPVEFLAGLPAGLARRAEWWRERVASGEPQGHTLVAVQDGDIVGFADISPSRDSDADPLEVGELNAIYVLPRAWGTGVGRLLMADTLRHLRAERFIAATLWVLEDNHRARRFYGAAGWTVDGSVKNETIGEFAVREIRYRIGFRNQS